jgi:pyruvyltransferase
MKAYWYKGDISNVGDMLTPYILKHLTGQEPEWSFDPGKFLAVGSIAEFISDNDIVFGSGFIQPMHIEKHENVTFLAVRGAKTAELLKESGYYVPDVLGDPAILMPDIYFPKVKKKYDVAFIPHYVEVKEFKAKYKGHYISVSNTVEGFISEMLQCKSVITSSLHAYILAEAYGINAEYVQLTDKIIGGMFKFEDYKSGNNDKKQLMKVFNNHFKNK